MSDTSEEPFLFADLALSRRLEYAEAQGNVGFVEARARVFPEREAEWIEVAGTYAMYDGEASPLTQTFCLGLFQPATPAEIGTIELFYLKHRALIFHEVSPLADVTTLGLLNDRGYQPVELTSVMFRPLLRGTFQSRPCNPEIQVRVAGDNEHEIWARTAARGWSESSELIDFLLELGQINAQRTNSISFIAELDNTPIATGAMTISRGVALLAGASTIPEARNRGAQRALLESRLDYAAEQGCDVAMMCALPGSASQRNAERQGFRIAYTRIKWQLARRDE